MEGSLSHCNCENMNIVRTTSITTALYLFKAHNLIDESSESNGVYTDHWDEVKT